MTMDTIVTLISSVGFPIAVCIGLFWYIIKMGETHKEEVAKLSTAIENNTMVIQKLIDKLDK